MNKFNYILNGDLEVFMKRFLTILSFCTVISSSVPAQATSLWSSLFESAKKPLAGFAATLGAVYGWYLYDTAVGKKRIKKAKKQEKPALKTANTAQGNDMALNVDPSQISAEQEAEQALLQRTIKVYNAFIEKYSVINKYIPEDGYFKSKSANKSVRPLDLDNDSDFKSLLDQDETLKCHTNDSFQTEQTLAQELKNAVETMQKPTDDSQKENARTQCQDTFLKIVKNRNELIENVTDRLNNTTIGLEFAKRGTTFGKPQSLSPNLRISTESESNSIGDTRQHPVQKPQTTPKNAKPIKRSITPQKQKALGICCTIASLAVGLWYIFKK